MRRLFLATAIGALALLGAPTAQAGPLQSAAFQISVGTLGPLTFNGSGSSAGSAFSSTSVSLNAGNALNGMQTTTLTAKQAPPLTKIVVTVTKNDAIKATGSPLVGVAGAVRGVSKQKGLGGATIISVPVAAGIESTNTIKGSVFNIKVQGKKWTSGMTTVTGLTGGTMSTFMTTGAVKTGASGTVTLVAVAKVTVTGAVNTITYTASKLNMTFDFVPEPAMPLMLVAGAATLALTGARRLRKS
jgi:hypothetical protein